MAVLADSTGTRRIDLVDFAASIDRDSLDLVLATLAQAGGSHEHAGLELSDDLRSTSLVRLSTPGWTRTEGRRR